MKYVCLGYWEEGRWEALTPSERDTFREEARNYDDLLRQNGHLVGAEALQSVRTTTTLKLQNGKLCVADGPFGEARGQLGGILVLEAKDLNHAIQLLSGCPGLRLGGCLEVRPTVASNLL